jgi:hypothetical protein
MRFHQTNEPSTLSVLSNRLHANFHWGHERYYLGLQYLAIEQGPRQAIQLMVEQIQLFPDLLGVGLFR